jgi:hypothetical protein
LIDLIDLFIDDLFIYWSVGWSVGWLAGWLADYSFVLFLLFCCLLV